MDFQETLAKELQELKECIPIIEYTQLKYILTMRYSDAIQFTIEEIEGFIKYIKYFQTSSAYSTFTQHWIDNMIDNFNYIIQKT